jgi:hypothetical protein
VTLRSELRASIRNRLEDSGGSPLYPDATLNDYISYAIHEYGRWAPLTDTTTVAVATDATSITIPAPLQEQALVAVRDATGADVRVMNGRMGFGALREAYTEQAWRHFDGKIVLQRKVSSSEAGNWTIDHLTPRPIPTDDVTALSILPGDEPAVLELAVARAIHQRALEDYKRGDSKVANVGLTLARETREEARSIFTRSRRRAVGGWMDVA